MSYRAIEMQLALPRTQDVGQIQDQLQQRGQMVQNQLAHAQLQEDLIKRKKIQELNQKEDGKIKDSDENNNSSYVTQNEKSKKKETSNPPLYYGHPYLGKNIDYNG